MQSSSTSSYLKNGKTSLISMTTLTTSASKPKPKHAIIYSCPFLLTNSSVEFSKLICLSLFYAGTGLTRISSTDKWSYNSQQFSQELASLNCLDLRDKLGEGFIRFENICLWILLVRCSSCVLLLFFLLDLLRINEVTYINFMPVASMIRLLESGLSLMMEW